MSKTLICVNVLDNVNAQVYGSHCNEWFRLGRNTHDEFILFHPNRLSIDNARNQAADLALRLECDYLFFLDDDMILSPNTYQSLKRCDADIAQALTFIRGYPFHCMAFKKGTEPGILEYYDDYHQWIRPNGIFGAEAVGFACVLIKCETLKKINKPYFITSTQSTEDVYFCIKLRNKLRDEVEIVVDTNVPTGHLLHPEIVSQSNVKELREKIKKMMPDEESDKKDRGARYLKECKHQFHE